MDYGASSSGTGVEARSTSEWIRACLRARLRAGNEDGQSMVEFAVALPVMMLVLTGIFAFGITISNNLALTNATGAAANQLANSRGLLTSTQNYDPCAAAVASAYALAPNLTRASLTFTFVLNGVSYSGTSCSSSSNTTGAAGNLVQGQAAKVTVTYPCSLAVYGANHFIGCLLTSTTSVLVQ